MKHKKQKRGEAEDKGREEAREAKRGADTEKSSKRGGKRREEQGSSPTTNGAQYRFWYGSTSVERSSGDSVKYPSGYG